MKITAQQARELVDEALNGKRRTNMERILRTVEDMAQMGKTSTKHHLFNDKGAHGKLKPHEKAELIELGYKVEEYESDGYIIIKW